MAPGPPPVEVFNQCNVFFQLKRNSKKLKKPGKKIEAVFLSEISTMEPFQLKLKAKKLVVFYPKDLKVDSANEFKFYIILYKIMFSLYFAMRK